ncbi:MAG: ABC transporter ATP-binding protein [candidate division Zixibacteria bacterium]|nr:ABC transporter ATP-binding protein [candidate division Zixibacteria bacterium]MDD5425809.1 ABC transporter ATP-binding protein [candidate division Zixibacteria bacterium]
MIIMHDIIKTYITGQVTFQALRGINLHIKKGEFVAIVGPSGSGKSTLMNIAGCLDIPTRGSYLLDGKQVSAFNSNQLAEIRNKKVGFVFQAFNLLPYATAYENVEVPLLFAGVNRRKRKERITRLLGQVGLAEKAANKPTEMSGGEMQRVAIARALANEPDIILADEPTGNLDSKSGQQIVNIFHELWKMGKTVLIITHDSNIAGRVERIIQLKDGQIENSHSPAAV